MVADLSDATIDGPKHSWNLEKETELRLEVGNCPVFNIKLIKGDAEIFGCELVPLQSYAFKQGAQFSILSWNGCSLLGTGVLEFAYKAKENLGLVHLNMHCCLLRKRMDARRSGERGPMVLVCGPSNCGKSTLCNTLTNYSTRSGYPIIFIDLDVEQGQVAPPGSLSAVLLDQPFLVNQEKSSHCPLAYFYGHTGVEVQPDLYRYYMEILASAVHEKLEKSSRIKAGGCIINACGYIVKSGLEMIKYAIQYFKASVVIVIEEELLFSQLEHLQSEELTLVLIPKSGGVVSRSIGTREAYCKARIHQYFYGIDNELHPYTFPANFDDFKLYNIGLPDASQFFLPVGVVPEKKHTSLVPVDPNTDMIHHMCAVSLASDTSEILSSNIGGYVIITGVDTENKLFTIFSPSPPPLPGKYLIIGSIKYMDLQ